jgi:hypothetical protein
MTGPRKKLRAARLVARREALEDVEVYLRHNGYIELADSVRNMAEPRPRHRSGASNLPERFTLKGNTDT